MFKHQIGRNVEVHANDMLFESVKASQHLSDLEAMLCWGSCANQSMRNRIPISEKILQDKQGKIN